jgi:hypothetical protein
VTESDSEQTLSLSLVDGITCALASALLLLVVFGVNIAASSAILGGTTGRGTTSTKLGDLPTEPMDIVVEVEGPIDAMQGNGWATLPDTQSGRAFDPSGSGRAVFIREIPSGIPRTAIKGSQAPARYVSFTLNWSKQTMLPRGTVRIYRSGNEIVRRFNCMTSQPSYTLIKSFDLVHATLKGDCFQVGA